jgi:hypothetical protein
MPTYAQTGATASPRSEVARKVCAGPEGVRDRAHSPGSPSGNPAGRDPEETRSLHPRKALSGPRRRCARRTQGFLPAGARPAPGPRLPDLGGHLAGGLGWLVGAPNKALRLFRHTVPIVAARGVATRRTRTDLEPSRQRRGRESPATSGQRQARRGFPRCLDRRSTALRSG